ncbi:3,4-dihydroxy-2-butanone 4-phosphate synthase [Cenarchaeum symbiosum A]|uniref:3,4-dihydroxy-2-butanone 4-phosphate synthase n=1 Tax=Cenarchaeum symbiosum (strain A) TaxID=414004 RepID=A0RYE9_CENSY|nr:3,4-dihydroxy-2-butanone 4-phosphate synthase [Cenarchaeum symbiosum A]
MPGMPLEVAIESLKRGEFVLVHDSEGRENEVDMVAAAGLVTPEHIARMRLHGGGLICLAIGPGLASALGLRYMHEMLSESPGFPRGMIMGLAPYGDRSTFSITVNHHRTYTGVTDRDRALTISEMAGLHGAADPRAEFVSSFRTPGHVPLLMASGGLLEERRGHTEMSVYLAGAAGLAPAAAICEMMDAETYTALSADKARRYAQDNGIPFVDGRELIEYAGVR